jgi:hypothetical protein
MYLRVLAPVATFLAVVTGCGASGSPPEVRADEPVRILFAGDSVLFEELADAALVALGDTTGAELAYEEGQEGVRIPPDSPSAVGADVYYLANAGVANPGAEQLLSASLDRFAPDIVVVLIGFWDEALLLEGREGNRPATPDLAAGYRQTVADYVRLATSMGSVVVWLGMPEAPRNRSSASIS